MASDLLLYVWGYRTFNKMHAFVTIWHQLIERTVSGKIADDFPARLLVRNKTLLQKEQDTLTKNQAAVDSIVDSIAERNLSVNSDDEALDEAKSNTKSEKKSSRTLERKEIINKLLKESSAASRSHRAPRAAHGKHPRWDEVFDDVESAYEAVGGYSGYGANTRARSGQKPTKNFAAQVDFPDGK